MTPKSLLHYLFALLLTLTCGLANAGWDPAKQTKLQREAAETIRAFQQKDPSLSRFFQSAAGWAVFPTVGKAGFWVGGAYGEGVVYEGGKAIGFSELKQLSVGFQFGGQAYSEIIFFKNKAAIDRFKAEKLEFDAQASAVIADKGAAMNADYTGGVAVFTMVKGGLMAEASVGGQHFTFTPK